MKKNSAADDISLYIVNAQEGDKDAFSALYTMYYKDMYRYALSILHNPYFAEDAVSEAVISAFKNIRSLKKKDSFKSWIFIILTNKCKKIAKETSNSYKGYFVDTGFDDTADICDNIVVRDAYDELDFDQKMVISLSVFAGFNSNEIGSILGMRPSSVRSIKKRALVRLKESLERMGMKKYE